jgi:hypothetical protein
MENDRDLPGKLTVCYWTWPSRYTGFTHEHGGSFHSYVTVYQRVLQSFSKLQTSMSLCISRPCFVTPGNYCCFTTLSTTIRPLNHDNLSISPLYPYWVSHFWSSVVVIHGYISHCIPFLINIIPESGWLNHPMYLSSEPLKHIPTPLY